MKSHLVSRIHSIFISLIPAATQEMGNCCLKRAPAKDIGIVNADISPDNEVANRLSHVGRAVYAVLQTKHPSLQQSLWNVTESKMVGESILQTPSDQYPAEGHSNWIAEKMCEIMSKTTRWCDVMTLAVPDGYFLDQFKKGLKNICEKNQGTIGGEDAPIIVRLMYGNIIGLPINCNKLIKELTNDLPEGANIKIWVGAWRAGQSWNHAKIIAADGRYLLTGGHNQWSNIYLKEDAVHDVSLEMEGYVAHDAHLFANGQWKFIEHKQDTWAGQILENVPDFLPLISKNRVIVSEYPEGVANEFAPYYNRSLVPTYAAPSDSSPVISVGRYGALTRLDRPSDDAITAMLDSSKNIIRMSIQDIGPVCGVGQIPLPGTGWPKQYLNALARAIWVRGVDVEIVLSDTDSRRGYTNGWSCSEVASEIIKRIETQFPNAEDSKIRQLVEENLRLCYKKHPKANHAKYFIVDDLCSYTGSQNLYVCDLAEWGVIIDDSAVTAHMLQDYWKPMWDASYDESDCNVHEVMDGLKIDREGVYIDVSTDEGRRQLDEAAGILGRNQLSIEAEMYDEEKEDIPGLASVQM